MSRGEQIEALRKKQPLQELKRKRDKARRKGYWTQEDMDYADMAAIELQRLIVINSIGLD